MARLLISKKGVMPKALLIAGILCIAFCFYAFASGMTKHHFGDSDLEDMAKKAAPILTGMLGLICIVGSFSSGKTCIMVYDDHIEGVGIGKGAFAPHTFHFANNLNYTVQQSGSMLKVSCGSESYSISLTAADAQDVYRCIYGGHTPQGAATQRPVSGANQAGNTYNPNTGTRPNAGKNTYAGTRTNTTTGTKTNTNTGTKTNTATNANSGTRTNTNTGTKPNTGSAANSAGQTVIVFCPHCGAKCRVPAGKGLIRISCPNPACKIPFTFET